MADPPTKGSLSPPINYVTPTESKGKEVHEIAVTASPSPPTFREKKTSRLSEDFEISFELQQLREQMEEEKARYPGANRWAPDEERLFEILYQREDLPILPSTWVWDLRQVPISDVLFDTSEEYPPIIYAHGNDFPATVALERLISLSAKVKANLETGLRQKVPSLIMRELGRYMSWAAQDGDYCNLRLIPNMITEVIDTTIPRDEITEYIQSRMRALGRLQREFLREDRDPEFWKVVRPNILRSPRIKIEPQDDSPVSEKRSRSGKRKFTSLQYNSHVNADELSIETPTRERPRKEDSPSKRRRLMLSRASDGFDELASFQLEDEKSTALTPRIKVEDESDHDSSNPSSHSSSPSSSNPSPKRMASEEPTYRRRPPVVYGLFILNTTVLLLTTDSSLGEDSYVSFHVQANFEDSHQSVWNALTIALAVCLARDELMTRKSDFEKLPLIEESDPDA